MCSHDFFRILFASNKQTGVTLTELVVVVAILTALVGVGIFSFLAFRTSSSLNGATDQALAALRLARSQTIASDSLSVYGVHFESNRAVIFPGPAYSPSDARNAAYAMPAGTQIVNVDLAGWPDVTFARISGAASGTGRIRIQMSQTPLRFREIMIREYSDLADAAGLPAELLTRITDTRHVHFDLGWSIQGATDLILTFTTNSGIQTSTISLSPYFSGGPPATSLDWSGVIAVDGMNQTLRINTHLLDSTNTVLSIHRNRMENTKQVAITIRMAPGDDRLVATYTSTGVLTVGPFGGTATVQ